MTEEMSYELKRCPFCGGKAEIVSVCDNEDGFLGYSVICADCGCGTVGCSEDESEAITLWNTRIEADE